MSTDDEIARVDEAIAAAEDDRAVMEGHLAVRASGERLDGLSMRDLALRVIKSVGRIDAASESANGVRIRDRSDAFLVGLALAEIGERSAARLLRRKEWRNG